MDLQTIADFACSQPDATALVVDGEEVSYRQFYGRCLRARAHLIDTRANKPGFAVVDLHSIGLTWTWVLACQSLGLTTVTCSHSTATALALSPIICIVGGEAQHCDGTIIVSKDAAEKCLGEGELELNGEIVATGHVMLSSGTTGLPKCVLFEPSSLATTMNFVNYDTVYDATTRTYIGCFPLFTAIGYLTPLRTWWSGGSVVIDQRPDVWAPFTSATITRAFLTPGMLNQLLDEWPDMSAFNPLMDLAIVGGIAPWPSVERAFSRLTPYISAFYGTTEAGRVARTPLKSAEDTLLYVIDEGRTVEICGEDDKACAVGDMGFVRIDTLTGVRDYWHDTISTKMFFQDGWFYTGDLGRLHSDGRLELMGRANDVVIIGGDKRSAHPLEQSIRDNLPVTDACVLQTPVGTGSETLHVFYESSSPLDTSGLEKLNDILPDNVKTVMHHRLKLPRNTMGKVARLMLRSDLK